MSPHGGSLSYCKASLGIIDAQLAVLVCFRGVPCLSVCFRLSERTCVFAQPLVTLTGTPVGTPVGTPLYTPVGISTITQRHTCRHVSRVFWFPIKKNGATSVDYFRL